MANHRLLAEHLELNGISNIELFDALVGPQDLPGVLFYEQGEATGINSVVGGGKREGFRQVRRRQVSLDRFCRSRGLSPEVIKIDVEVAELGVLQGGVEVIRRRRPLIFLSVHPSHLSALGQDTEMLAGLIGDLGYRCCDMEGLPVRQIGLDEYRLEPEG